MAGARITHTWADGTKTEMVASLDENYPDALDECRVQVTRMYGEMCRDSSEAPEDQAT